MTREEVKKYLMNMREAINALEQELCEDISEDGTLTVNVEDGTKVSRVFVCGDNHFGGLYYPEQEPCNNAISREAAIDVFERFIHELGIKDEPYNYGEMALSVENVPPITPQPKMGQWILTQRDKCIEISCSECGNIRFRDYAGISRGYTAYELNHDKINDLLVEFRMNYCECCGAKMQEVEQ